MSSGWTGSQIQLADDTKRNLAADFQHEINNQLGENQKKSYHAKSIKYKNGEILTNIYKE